MISQTTTFGSYVLDWINIKHNVVEDSTYYMYLDVINSLLINFKNYDLANKQLHNLSPKVFQLYLNALAEKYSRASITKIWQLISQCVQYGESQNEIMAKMSFVCKDDIYFLIDVLKE